MKSGNKMGKRLLDITAAAAGIAVTSPLWLLAVIGIELSDPGPVFYMANRVGKNDQVFRMFKFRSMRVDRHADEKGFKADTNRIFAFGELIRRTKIDELPQLLNILIGQMSVVGPRPASVDQVEIVRGGKYSRISELTPGLTGPSALYDYVYGDSIEDEEEYRQKVLPTRLALDLAYIDRCGMGYDIVLIFQTVGAIVKTVLKLDQSRFLDKLIEMAEPYQQ